jgi:cysteine synthase B
VRAQSLLAAVGRTPLVELDSRSASRLFVKLETANPGGSLKDRAVVRMLTRALSAGSLAGGRRLLDSSSGNAGIAYAMFGAALGVPVTLVIPANASRERLERIAAHGAELILTDPLEGYDHAVLEARRLAREEPQRYWHADQYANADNWQAHFETTGLEILEQVRERTGRAPDAFVAGVGTGGSLTGIGRRLRQANPALHVTAIVPETFPGIEGLKPLGHPGDFVPEILDESLIDERIPVTMEQAIEGCQALAREGLFAGPSSGAYVRIARQIGASGEYPVVVTLICDTGERYGSTTLWERGG